MNILIFGANGWIGSKVVLLLAKLAKQQKQKQLQYVKAKSRADDIESIRREISEQSEPITHIMSFIGRTHGVHEGKKITTIDYLEKEGKLVENVRDNLFAPVALALLCKELNIHFTYLGTGCIFDGFDKDGFTEESKPNFFGSSYSIVKGFTDQLMHLLENTVLNVRIRMPITDEFNERNFIYKITHYERICSIPNSMTVLNELLPIMIDMALFKRLTGTINLTNPGLISHNEILKMYKDIVDKDFEWKNFSIEEQNEILLSKRSNNLLDTSKLEELYPNVSNIQDSVGDILKNMKKNKKNI